MVLSHFSHYFKFDSEFQYADPDTFKPKGLWLSDESSNLGWKEWCEGEKFGLSNLKSRTDFVCDTSNWIVLRNKEEIIEFTKRFSISPYPDVKYIKWIDWKKVKDLYSGILITPYLWECRLDIDCHWYYGWDCASACVWDLSTIKEVKVGNKSKTSCHA